MRYGLIGGRLAHSYSPEIHAKIGDYPYELLELKPEELEGYIKGRDFAAINVTIPYKQAVMPLLDEISEDALSIGAVNTIVNRGGRLCGFNTDFAGMTALIRHAGIELSGRNVLILGTGGTSKTARAVAKALGAREIHVASRSPGEGEESYGEAVCRADANVIINCTPCGMYPDNDGIPVEPRLFPALEGIADAVYNPLRTNLVLSGRAAGLPSEGGLYMLASQAVYAYGLFFGAKVDDSLTDGVYGAVLAEKRSLVLTGMPSSGKTEVGKLLSRLLGKPFIDTDAQIVEGIGMPIAEFFAQKGEPEFRGIEKEVIRADSQRGGCIIATGGGAVLDADNIRALKRNGLVLFLDRSPEKLTATADRPLSSDIAALRALYEKRYPIYSSAADIRIDGDGSLEQTAAAIRKAVNE